MLEDTAGAGTPAGTRTQTNGRPALRRHQSESKTTSGKDKDRPAPSRSSSVASETQRKGSCGSFDMQFVTSLLSHSNIANLKSIISKHSFACLSPEEQLELVKLLPECDQVAGPDNVLRMSHTALNNEFFSKSLSEWKDKASEGEFVVERRLAGGGSAGGRSAGLGAAGDGGAEKDHARCESLRSSSSSASALSNGVGGCGAAGANNGSWTELCRAFRERNRREIPKAGPAFIPTPPKVAASRTKRKRPPPNSTLAIGTDVSAAAAAKPGAPGSTPIAAVVADVSRVADCSPAVGAGAVAAAAASTTVAGKSAVQVVSAAAVAASGTASRKRPLQRPGRRSALLGVGASLLRAANVVRTAAPVDGGGTRSSGGASRTAEGPGERLLTSAAAAVATAAACNGREPAPVVAGRTAGAAAAADNPSDFTASCLLATAAEKAKKGSCDPCPGPHQGALPEAAAGQPSGGAASVPATASSAVSEQLKRSAAASRDVRQDGTLNSKKARLCATADAAAAGSEPAAATAGCVPAGAGGSYSASASVVAAAAAVAAAAHEPVATVAVERLRPAADSETAAAAVPPAGAAAQSECSGGSVAIVAAGGSSSSSEMTCASQLVPAHAAANASLALDEQAQGQAKTLAQIKALTRAKQMLKNSVSPPSLVAGCPTINGASAAPAAPAAGGPDGGVAAAAVVLGSGSPPADRSRPRPGAVLSSSPQTGVADGGVNLQRSLAICQASSCSPQAINYMRSYEICKEVLQKSNNTGMMSLLCKQQQQHHAGTNTTLVPATSADCIPPVPSEPAEASAGSKSSLAPAAAAATVGAPAKCPVADLRVGGTPAAIAAAAPAALPVAPTPPEGDTEALSVTLAEHAAVPTAAVHVPGEASGSSAMAVGGQRVQAAEQRAASSQICAAADIQGASATSVAATPDPAGTGAADERLLLASPSELPLPTRPPSLHTPPPSSPAAVCAAAAFCEPSTQPPEVAESTASLPAPVVTSAVDESGRMCPAMRERVVALLRAKWQDRNLAQHPLTAVSYGGGVYNRRRRKPTVTSHPFLSMTDKDYAYSIKVHKKKVAMRPLKKHKMKGKKAAALRAASYKQRRATMAAAGAAAASGAYAPDAAALRCDSASIDDWGAAADSDGAKAHDGTDCTIDGTRSVAPAAASASSDRLSSASSASSASVADSPRAAGTARRECAGACSKPPPALANTSASGATAGEASAAAATAAAVRPEAAGDSHAECSHKQQQLQQSPRETWMQTVATAAGAGSTVKLASSPAACVQPSSNCGCNLKAMRECQKCGAFCHEDCIGSSNLCVSCLVSI